VAVSFRVNDRTIAVDRSAPFSATIGPSRFRAGVKLVRARVSFKYDRVVTKDLPLSVCRHRA
jgi:hypothetical protein